MDSRTRFELERRGIDPDSDIVGERPYTPYCAGDVATLYAEDPKYRDELRPGQARFIRQVIGQRDGVIMRRHACIPGLAEPWAQIRPHRDGKDDPGVWIQDFAHRHPWAYIHMHDRDGDLGIYVNPRGDGVHPKRLHSRRWIEDHERNHPRGPDEVPSELKPDLELGDMHAHWKDWSAHMRTGEYAEQHASDLKGGVFHVHRDFARYLYAPADPDRPESGKERSAGIDVHPIASDLIDRGGRRIYYAIEGVLKNDALLAQGVPVFDTGSVTLWLPDELREFARQRLVRFERVIVVPDSDWHSNWQVSRQANRIADLLRIEGLDVEIAAPPAKCGTVCRHKDRATRRDHKNGADDFIGQGGNVRQFIRLQVDQERAPQAIASKRRVALLIEHVYSHSDINGNVYQSVDEMSDAVGVSRDTVMDAIADAETEGLIKYDVPDPEPGQRMRVGTLTLRRDLRPTFSFEEIGD